MSSSYPVPSHNVCVESEVKKSRFIARALRCTDRAQALANVEQARQDFPDARHHCWAYQLGDPKCPDGAAMNDDGEPSGTAGKPILNVINHRGVGDLQVIVIRYFGGIKLGAGGLVRAYSQATGLAIDALTVTRADPRIRVSVACNFAQEQLIRHWLNQHSGELHRIEYGNCVTLDISLPQRFESDWGALCLAHRLSELP